MNEGNVIVKQEIEIKEEEIESVVESTFLDETQPDNGKEDDFFQDSPFSMKQGYETEKKKCDYGMSKDIPGQFIIPPRQQVKEDHEYSNEERKPLATASSCLFKCLNCTFKCECQSTLRAVVLQKKWKNIKDHYRKESARRKTEPSGSGASSARKEYIYYSQLSFLSSIVETRPPKSNSAVEEDTDVQTARRECVQDLPKIQTKKKKVSGEDALIGALTANIYKQIQEPKDDADKDFLMSLLPYVKSIPDSAKLECKCEIMHVLKKYNTPSINHMQYAPHPNSHINYQNYQAPIQNSQPVLGHYSYEMQNRQTPGASLPAFSPLSTQSVASSDSIIEELV